MEITDEQKKKFVIRTRELLNKDFGTDEVQACYNQAFEEITGVSVKGDEIPCGNGKWFCDLALCHGPQWCKPDYPRCAK